MYLTEEEYIELGFEPIPSQFDTLLQRAELLINRFINDFYLLRDFESDYPYRKSLVKKAVAFQIDYLEKSGIMSAEDKQSMTSVTVGRTRVDFGHQQAFSFGGRYNLSTDSYQYLQMAGFGTAEVSYDR